MPEESKGSLRRQLGCCLIVVSLTLLCVVVLTRGSSKPFNEFHSSAPTDGGVKVDPVGERVTDIETAPVRYVDSDPDLHVSGAASFPAELNGKVSPRVAGRVREVNVRVGDHVSAGQTLALLESIDAVTAVNSARQNENKLRLAIEAVDRESRLYRLGTSDVTQAQATLDQATTRTLQTRGALDRVKEQAAIGGFSEKPLEDARNALAGSKLTAAQAHSDLALAEKDFDRKSLLYKGGISARSEFELSQNVLEKAKAAVAAADESVALSEQAVKRETKAFQGGLYADQQMRSAQGDYDQAQLQQRAAERGVQLARTAILRELEQAKSDYKSAQFDLETSRRTLIQLGNPDMNGVIKILSPVSGVVTERDVNPGQVVDQSQMTPWQMFAISSVSTMCVFGDVYEKDLPRVSVGQSAFVSAASLPHFSAKTVIAQILPGLDPKTHTAKIRLDIPNTSGQLRDGMFVNVVLSGSRKRPIPAVPLTAIQHDGDKTVAFFSVNGKYVRRTVHVIEERSGEALLDGDFRPEDRIVTHGAIFLMDQGN